MPDPKPPNLSLNPQLLKYFVFGPQKEPQRAPDKGDKIGPCTNHKTQTSEYTPSLTPKAERHDCCEAGFDNQALRTLLKTTNPHFVAILGQKANLPKLPKLCNSGPPEQSKNPEPPLKALLLRKVGRGYKAGGTNPEAAKEETSHTSLGVWGFGAHARTQSRRGMV